MSENNSHNIFRGASKTSLFTLVSRFLGFVWNLLIARTFGAGILTDCFFIAYRIPNLLRSFLGEGALTSAFVPVFAAENSKDKKLAESTLRATVTLLLGTSLLISLLGIFFAETLVTVIAPGLANDPENFKLCVVLTRITLPYIVFISLVSLLSGVLNTLKIYGSAPIAQCLMNLVLITFTWLAALFNPEAGLELLCYAVLIGGLVQLILQIKLLQPTKLNFLPVKNFLTKSSKKILFLMLPACFAATIYQVAIFTNTILASFLPAGSISWLFYADRITQLPIGLITMSVATVLLPAISENSAGKDSVSYNKNINNSLRFISFLVIPISAYLICFALPITQILFERGEFTYIDSKQTAVAIQAAAIGLWGVSCLSIINRGFFAKQDTLTPSIIGLIVLTLNILISLLTMGLITDNNTSLAYIISSIQSSLYQFFPAIDIAHTGLALASGLATTLTLPVAVFLLKRKQADWDFLLLVKKALCFLLAAVFSYFICRNFIDMNSGNIFTFILNSLIFFALYFIILIAGRNSECLEVIKIFRRKLLS